MQGYPVHKINLLHEELFLWYCTGKFKGAVRGKVSSDYLNRFRLSASVNSDDLHDFGGEQCPATPLRPD